MAPSLPAGEWCTAPSTASVCVQDARAGMRRGGIAGRGPHLVAEGVDLRGRELLPAAAPLERVVRAVVHLAPGLPAVHLRATRAQRQRTRAANVPRQVVCDDQHTQHRPTARAAGGRAHLFDAREAPRLQPVLVRKHVRLGRARLLRGAVPPAQARAQQRDPQSVLRRVPLKVGGAGGPKGTRRVRLVRRDGRDVSTLYGRGGEPPEPPPRMLV